MRPASYWDPILERHAGPYVLQGSFDAETKKGAADRTAWLKRRGRKIEWTNEAGDDLDHVKHDADEVVGECYGYLREPGGPASIFVYSTSEQQFVGINVKREDAEKDGMVASESQVGRTGVPGVPDADAVRAGAVEPLAPVPDVRVHRVPKPGAPAVRGGRYRFVKDPAEKLGTTPRLVLEEFKRRGAATVADVAAAIESSLTTADAKALVASHATRLKAAGLLEKE